MTAALPRFVDVPQQPGAPQLPQKRYQLRLPRKLMPLMSSSRYKASWGGRGSAKSHSFARALLARASAQPLRWLCCREIQKSIKDSVKRLLDDRIAEMSLTTRDGQPFWESLDTELRAENGSWIGFAGLRTNPESIKSMEGLDGAWVEEADTVSQASLDMLVPTVRKPGSELWFSWNPRRSDDPVDVMFRGAGGPPPDTTLMPVSWRDNPWFPDVLREEMEWARQRDPDKYHHVWEGGYQRRSEARVFRNWRVASWGEDLEPPYGTILRLGADWGFSVDPSVLVRSWERRTPEGRDELVVDYEAWGVGVEIDQLPALFSGQDDPRGRWKVPAARRWNGKDGPESRGWRGVPGATEWTIRADSARPDTISYMRNRGFRIVPATKGPGSVEDGVEFLQSRDIVVHPRCTHVIDELTSYSWKTDKHTEEILPVLEESQNHTIDSLRYAHEGARRGNATVTRVLGHI